MKIRIDKSSKLHTVLGIVWQTVVLISFGLMFYYANTFEKYAGARLGWPLFLRSMTCWLATVVVFVRVLWVGGNEAYKLYEKMPGGYLDEKNYKEPVRLRTLFHFVFEGKQYIPSFCIGMTYVQLALIIAYSISYWCVIIVDPKYVEFSTYLWVIIEGIWILGALFIVVYRGFIWKYKRLTWRNLKYLLARYFLGKPLEKEPQIKQLGRHRIKKVYRKNRYVEIEENKSVVGKTRNIFLIGKENVKPGMQVQVYEICKVKYAERVEEKR